MRVFSIEDNTRIASHSFYIKEWEGVWACYEYVNQAYRRMNSELAERICQDVLSDYQNTFEKLTEIDAADFFDGL